MSDVEVILPDIFSSDENRKDPGEDPNWQPIRRETMLARELIGAGVTSLGKANHADRKGEYYNAFFGLSIGIERLAKLILVTDCAIRANGRMPPASKLKKFGHKIVQLLEEVDEVAKSNGLNLTYERPKSSISKATYVRCQVVQRTGSTFV